jgi:predicted nucleotidyltransferase
MQLELTKQELIDEIARRLIEFYRPVRVCLFSSAARGESGLDSDLDFCVVLPDDAPDSLYRDRHRLKPLAAVLPAFRAAGESAKSPYRSAGIDGPRPLADA